MTSYCNQTVSVVKNNDCCSPTKHTEKYSVTLTVSDTWIMPEVTETTVLSIPNCNNILPGSWLWNPNVGYLEVVKYNVATGDTVVRNIGFDGNARVGTVFPSCMDFTVTGPIYLDSIDDNVTCLAADFVSPEVGSCALMKVKSTANLKKDYIIAIEIYQYKVDAVIDNYTIRACNYGLGKVGIIEANCDDKCVPVRAINANSPCLQDEVHAANAIAVCVGGESKILVGTEEGQIATWSNGSGEWQLINSNIEVDCTVTTNFVNIIYGNAGPYLLNVVSTAPFKVGDRITFNNEHDAYTVSEIISDTQIRLLRNEPPTEFDYVIDAGARLCIVDCCDWLPAYVENLAARITDVENVNNTQNTQINNLNKAVDDLQQTKADNFFVADLLTSPTGVLDIDRSYHVIFGNTDATITLDTDLSKYDNTQKHFVVDGANVGTGSAGTFTGHTDDNTTGDRVLNFRSIKSGDTDKLTVTQQGDDIVITSIYDPEIIPTSYSFYVASQKEQFGIGSIPGPTAADVTTWTTNNMSNPAIKTLSQNVVNTTDRPMTLLIYSFMRLYYWIGMSQGTHTVVYDGWVEVHQEMGTSITINGNTSILNGVGGNVVDTQEPQKYIDSLVSGYHYHYIPNTITQQNDVNIATLPANTSCTIEVTGTIFKTNDDNISDGSGGILTWQGDPLIYMKIIGMVS